MHVVVAPDSFKGSASAPDVASALADGWRSVRPGDTVELVPMADGGEGTLDAFEVALPGSRRFPVRVPGPIGEQVDADWLLLPDGSGVVELASTSGITLLDTLQPLDAQATGFGVAIEAALEAGVGALYLAVGGSSSTDGGVGALRALGARFLDAAGDDIPPGGRGLLRLAAVDLTGLAALPAGGVFLLCDVTNPLLGPTGSAAVFGPQKGASPSDVADLEAGLSRLAGLVDVDQGAPGAGAAGGTAFGMLAWGARLQLGSSAIGELLGLPGRIDRADVVLTGEGRYDDQSASGKVAGYVRGLAAASGVDALLAAGGIAAPTNGFAGAAELVALAGSLEAALDDPLRWLRAAGAALAGGYDSAEVRGG